MARNKGFFNGAGAGQFRGLTQQRRHEGGRRRFASPRTASICTFRADRGRKGEGAVHRDQHSPHHDRRRNGAVRRRGGEALGRRRRARDRRGGAEERGCWRRVEVGGGEGVGVVGHLERSLGGRGVGEGVEVRRGEEEVRGRRHGGGHVLQGRRGEVGGGRRSFQVLLLFVPHGPARPATGPAPSPRAAANHADALHRLDALPGQRAVGVAQSLDGGPLGAGRHQGLYAVILALLPVRRLFAFQLPAVLRPGARLTGADRVSPLARRSHPRLLLVFLTLHVATGRRGDPLPSVHGVIVL